MNNDTDIFSRIMDKYLISREVPSEVQSFIVLSRKKNLEKVLIRAGAFGFFFWFVMTVNFALKKFGIHATIIQSKIIAGICAASVASASSMGAYVTGKYVYEEVIVPQWEEIQKKDADHTKKIEFDKPSVNPAPEMNGQAVKYMFGILPFIGEDAAVNAQVNNYILNEIKRVKGEDSIIPLHDQRSKNINNIVIGSVRMIGGSYSVSAKVIDAESSKVLIAFMEKADDAAELEAACRKIAGEIALYSMK